MPFTSSHLMDRYVRPNWKAVVGFVAPTATLLTYAVTDASAAGEHITQGEWITAICAAFLTGGGVYAKGNKDPRAEHQTESVQPPGPEVNPDADQGYPDQPQDDGPWEH